MSQAHVPWNTYKITMTTIVEGIEGCCDRHSQTPHTPPHTMFTSLPGDRKEFGHQARAADLESAAQ
eukprot:5644166-Pyramimonas_sp.AAC.1